MKEGLNEIAVEPQTRTELANITGEIVKMYPDAKVVLFGSFARGEQRKWSDLDLCVLVDKITERRLDQMFKIRKAVDRKTKHPMDLLLYEKEEFNQCAVKKSRLEHVIEEEGVLLNA